MKLAFSGSGRGMAEKESGPLSPLPETVKLKVLPTLTVLLPMGLRVTPEDTLKVEEALAELVARSDTETETVCGPGERFKPFKSFKVKPKALMVA